MSAIRSTGNQTEVRLRKRLFHMGYRYRIYCKDLPGHPDLVFRKEKIAVFVDGDYWHCRTLREVGAPALEAKLRGPTRDYWRKKFIRRVAIDDEVTETLGSRGWLVIRLWESAVRADLNEAAARIAGAVVNRRDALAQTSS